MWEYFVKALRPLSKKAPDADVRAAHSATGAEMARTAPDARHMPPPENAARQAATDPRSSGGEAPPPAQRGLHCPACQAEMETRRLRSVEIDCCPACGGVFLDRGELEELSGEWGEESARSDDDSRRLLLYTPHGLTGSVRDHGD